MKLYLVDNHVFLVADAEREVSFPSQYIYNNEMIYEFYHRRRLPFSSSDEILPITLLIFLPLS